MSDGSNPGATAKAAGGLTSENKDQEKALQTTQKAAQLEEDDEFEDFPVEDWAKEEEVGAQQQTGTGNTHLWEESWDDDDTQDEFSVQLKEQLKEMSNK